MKNREHHAQDPGKDTLSAFTTNAKRTFIFPFKTLAKQQTVLHTISQSVTENCVGPPNRVDNAASFAAEDTTAPSREETFAIRSE